MLGRQACAAFGPPSLQDLAAIARGVTRSKAVRPRSLQTAGFEGLFHEEVSREYDPVLTGRTMMGSHIIRRSSSGATGSIAAIDPPVAAEKNRG